MPIFLKLVKRIKQEEEIMELCFCMDNDEEIPIDSETALNEGFTLSNETLNRLSKLVELGQKYEEVDKSHKLEFKDLNIPEES